MEDNGKKTWHLFSWMDEMTYSHESRRTINSMVDYFKGRLFIWAGEVAKKDNRKAVLRDDVKTALRECVLLDHGGHLSPLKKLNPDGTSPLDELIAKAERNQLTAGAGANPGLRPSSAD